jgi:hypothetical protein
VGERRVEVVFSCRCPELWMFMGRLMIAGLGWLSTIEAGVAICVVDWEVMC